MARTPGYSEIFVVLAFVTAGALFSCRLRPSAQDEVASAIRRYKIGGQHRIL